MTVVEYIRKKNKILKELTGITLIPESQIKEVPKFELDIDRHNDSGICPYCLIYLDSSIEYELEQCIGCPMKEQGNRCYNVLSTYNQILQRLPEDILSIPDIQNLVKEYNSQFK